MNQKKLKTIFIISGLVDIQIAGNQAITNTIRYFAKGRFKVCVFSSLPKNYFNLANPEKTFGKLEKNIKFYRLPVICEGFFNFTRFLKNSFRKNRKSKSFQYSSVGKSFDYFVDFKILAQFIYFLSWLLYILFELPRVFFAVLKERPNLFYGYEIYGAPVASILSVIFKKPVITRFQGTALNVKKKSQWKYFLHHVLGLKSRANAIIMCNDGTRGDEVLKELDIPEHKINFWMDGLPQDIANFYIDKEKIEQIREKTGLNNKKIVLSVNKLKVWKRIDRIIYILYKLVNDYGTNNIVLLIVGDGPEKDNLKKLASNYKVESFIRWMGPVPHCEIGKYYSVANCYLITNDVSNLGNPLQEALYFGCPIVSLKDGSTDELLQDGYNSLLVPLNKIEEDLPKAVYKILTDKDLAGKLSENARITAKEKILSWEERMKKEIDLINILIKK